jgi:hypothetical protein
VLFFGLTNKSKPPATVLDTMRDALMFGSYRIAGKDGFSHDSTFERLVSDDYWYIAGMLLVGNSWLVYLEVAGEREGRYFSDRAVADRCWRDVSEHVSALIGADPAVDVLPNLARTFGWAWFRDLVPKRNLIDSFESSFGVRACLQRISDSNLRLYFEYMERGVEKNFDDARTASAAFDVLRQATSRPNPPWVARVRMRPKRFLPVILESGPDPYVALGGRAALGGTAYAWGSLEVDGDSSGWFFAKNYRGCVVLPVAAASGAQSVFEALVAGLNAETALVESMFA